MNEVKGLDRHASGLLVALGFVDNVSVMGSSCRFLPADHFGGIFVCCKLVNIDNIS